MRKESQSKFNVSKSTEKRTCEGIVFDSALEMRYFRDVVLPMVGSGEVVAYELQKPYILQEKFTRNGKTVQPIKYVADFYLVFADGHAEIIDIKGMADVAAKLKRKLFWYIYPELDYHWVGYSKIDGGWVDYDTIQQARSNRKKEKKNKEKLNAE